ncbi:MAG: helix-turn-helix domain-containing protein [Clostridiales bacterium]|nr:helix-turn-helix domain-containing protein [Clostridiales bacterium]
MNTAEIVLLIVGGIILLLSFILPAWKEKTNEKEPQIDKGQIKELVEKEVEEAKKRIGDIVDETVTYSMEKTERTMERLANEKIMAVNEYSDLVLDKINKNHNEVIFLYDMLNDKHENLVNTVSAAGKVAKEIQQVVKQPEEGLPFAEEKTEEAVSVGDKTVEIQQPEFVPIAPEKVEVKRGGRRKAADAEKTKVVGSKAETKSKTAKSAPAAVEEKSINNNEKILNLHKEGKSQTEIAKELGLGVGEVKLVIDLFEQA